MAQTPQDDFDKKYGGGTATATAPAVGASDDFDKKYGAASAAATPPTTADNEVERAGKEAFVTKHPIIAGAARGITTLGGMLPESTHASDYTVAPGAWQMITHPIDSAKLLNEGMVQPMLNAGQSRYDKMFQAADVAKKDWQTGHPVKAAVAATNAATYGAEGTVPVVGPWVGGLADELGHGIENRKTPEGQEEIAHAITSPLAAGLATHLTTGEIKPNPTAAAVGEKIAPHIPDAVMNPREAVAKKIWQPPTDWNSKGIPNVDVPSETVSPAPGDLKPGAKSLARVGGALTGAGAGALGVGHIPGLDLVPGAGAGGALLGGVEGYKMGPGVVQKLFPEPNDWVQHRAMDADWRATPKSSAPDLMDKTKFPTPPAPAGATIPQAGEIPTPMSNAEIGRNVEQGVREAAGTQPLKPNVPLREQLTPTPAPKTEAPAAEAPKRTSIHSIYGDDIGEELRTKPDLQQYFAGKKGEGFTNVKARQALINAGHDMGQQVVNNKMLQGEGAIKPGDAVKILRDKGYSMEQIRDLAEKK